MGTHYLGTTTFRDYKVEDVKIPFWLKFFQTSTWVIGVLCLLSFMFGLLVPQFISDVKTCIRCLLLGLWVSVGLMFLMMLTDTIYKKLTKYFLMSLDKHVEIENKKLESYRNSVASYLKTQSLDGICSHINELKIYEPFMWTVKHVDKIVKGEPIVYVEKSYYHKMNIGQYVYRFYLDNTDVYIESILVPKPEDKTYLDMWNNMYMEKGGSMLIDMTFNGDVILKNPKFNSHVGINPELVLQMLDNDFGITLFTLINDRYGEYRVMDSCGCRLKCTYDEVSNILKSIEWEVKEDIESVRTKLERYGKEIVSDMYDNAYTFHMLNLNWLILSLPSNPNETKIFVYKDE